MRVFLDPAEASMLGTFNVRTVGPTQAFGTFCGAKFFDQRDTGIVISTGNVQAFNQATPQEDFSPLNSMFGDDVGFEIRFRTTSATSLQFSYVFASRELPEYMGQPYNDAFAMNLNNVNIAVLPSSCYPMGKSTCNQPEADGTCHVTISNMGMSPTRDASWSPCYVNNPNKQYFAGYTGYTSVLTAQASLRANTDYTLNITIRDVQDGKYDSVVLLEAGTFRLGSARGRRSVGTAGLEEQQQQQQQQQSLLDQESQPDGHSTTVLVMSCVMSLVLGGIIASAFTIIFHRRQQGKMDCTHSAAIVEMTPDSQHPACAAHMGSMITC
jgi:hypothetical protein